MSRYNSDTLPADTLCTVSVGDQKMTLSADSVAGYLSRAYTADSVDLLMLTLDTKRELSIVRKGQRLTFKVKS